MHLVCSSVKVLPSMWFVLYANVICVWWYKFPFKFISFCSLSTSNTFIFETSNVSLSSANSSSIDISNNSDSLFSDSILGSKSPDSYFETVPALTPKILAISFWVIFLFSLYFLILSPNIIKTLLFRN